MKHYYIFADPVNSRNSGITSYINNSRLILEPYFHVLLISRESNEDIEKFAKRLAKEINQIDFEQISCIEVPETYCVSKYIDSKFPIHIRLHCSKLIGQFIQGNKIDQKILKDESIEISKARWISSPSRINYFFTSFFYKLPNKVSVFPNPQLEIKANKNILHNINKRKKVVFLGRWDKLKGTDYFSYLAEKYTDNPNIEFIALVPKIPTHKFRNINFVIVDSDYTKYYYLSDAYICIVPSFYESYSMVIAESIVMGVQVITWKHIGACEFYNKNMVHTVMPFSKSSLLNKFNKLIIRDQKSFNLNEGESVTHNLNEIYRKSVLSMVNKNELNYKSNLIDSMKFNFIIPFFKNHRKRLIMNKKIRKYRKQAYKKIDSIIDENNNPSKILRLSRKAIVNPYLFLTDTKIISNSSMAKSLIKFTKLSEIEPLQVEDIKKINKVKKISNSNCNIKFNSGFFLFIKRNEKIIFRTNNIPKNSNLIVFSDISVTLLEKLKESYMLSNENFMLSKNNFIAKFKIPNNKAVINEFELFSYIDPSKLSLLNEFRTIILFNPTDEIINFFNYGTFNVPIIGIFSDNSINHLRNVSCINNIVVDKILEYKEKPFQTIHDFKNIEELRNCLDKFIKYNVARDFDYLLPIYKYSNEHDEIYKNFDYENYDGFIKFTYSENDTTKSFSCLLKDSLMNVESIAIVESIYNRYPKVISDIYNNKNISDNLLFLLKKGIRFDVIN